MTLDVAIRHRQGSFTLDAAFRAERGVTALFGRSGSGKTTLVNAIAGLLRPEHGHIAVDGTTLLDTQVGCFVPMHRRRIGYVFQEGRLFPHLTVRQNLLFGRFFAPSRARREDGLTLDAVVDLLGIAALLSRRPARLSGGEKQRVAIGRALLSRPRLLLMDEPLAALDDARKAEILPTLERLRDEAGVPIVYVSHAIAEVARLANTLVVLENGRVAAAGPTGEVLGFHLGLAAFLDDHDAGTVLDARITAHDSRFGLTSLDTGAGSLLVPRLDRPVGAQVRALLRARDVMLCLARPSGISALNVLAGTIAELAPSGAASMEVRLNCAPGGHLLARVTRKSAEELGLVPGMAVFAVIKTVSFDPDPVVAARGHDEGSE